MVGQTTGSFKWQVTQGTSIVNLNNGGSDSDTIGPVNNDNTVTVKSTGASSPPGNDVTIAATYDGVTFTNFKMTVLAPDSVDKTAGPSDSSSSGFGGTFRTIRTEYTFEVLDQMGADLPHGLSLNEKFRDRVNNVTNSGWDDPDAVGTTSSDNTFKDIFAKADYLALHEPDMVAHTDSAAGDNVFSVIQEYKIGSATVGNGELVSTHTVQFSRGYTRSNAGNHAGQFAR